MLGMSNEESVSGRRRFMIGVDDVAEKWSIKEDINGNANEMDESILDHLISQFDRTRSDTQQTSSYKWEYAFEIAESLGFVSSNEQQDKTDKFWRSEILLFLATEIQAMELLLHQANENEADEKPMDEDDEYVRNLLADIHEAFDRDYKLRLESKELMMKMCVRAFSSVIPENNKNNKYADQMKKILAAVEDGEWNVESILNDQNVTESNKLRSFDIPLPTSLSSPACQISDAEREAFSIPAASKIKKQATFVEAHTTLPSVTEKSGKIVDMSRSYAGSTVRRVRKCNMPEWVEM